ncbi:family 20 glycosylhydrolase [Rudaea sp.]|uniref:family 20 glycosylhydrolase n=1 Tax=Rudaea sp. TaxID=2136325 RepID=UPI0037836A26
MNGADRRFNTRCARWCCVLALLLQAVFAFAASQPAPLQLQWETVKIGVADSGAERHSEAAFVLTNRDSRPLPASGWAIYFDCLADARTGEMPGHVRVERVNGGLFRLRPIAGFKALAPGDSVRLTLIHPAVMFNIDKAPKAPYFVNDAAIDVGHPISDYRVTLPKLADQVDPDAGEHSPPAGAEEIFERNRIIADVAENDLAPVFPTPRHFVRGKGRLTWSTLPRIDADATLANEAAQARAMLASYIAAGARQGAKEPVLTLRVAAVDGETSTEAYALSVDPASGVRITGNTAAGVARGLQSLRELLPLQHKAGEAVTLGAITLTDAPRFAYRGFMLDVARNFQDKPTVLRLLDLMARYKLNTFHFHLTDDEGWRLDIAGLPELTAFGARRGHSTNEAEYLFPAFGSGPDVDDAHGSGHYTRADYIEILKYAAARHIEVIPEIEMPGHARAAIKAMAWRARHSAQTDAANTLLLTDPGDKSVYASAQLYTDNVMDPGLESTYAFIERVVADLVAMHKEAGVPLTTLHVGGDEVPRGVWEQSPAVRKLMQARHLDSVAQVWDVFYDRVDRILRAHGLATAGWEELGARRTTLRGKSKLIPNPTFVQRGFTLHVWNNTGGAEDLAYRLANAGYDVVLSPATNLYADMAYSRDPEEPGMNWAAYVDLGKVYDFIPLDSTRKDVTDPAGVPGLDGLTEYGEQHVRGVEATLFGETLRSRERIDYLLMPRLLGTAELGWARDPAWTHEVDRTRAASAHAAAWSAFVNQIGKRVLPRLDAEHAGVVYRIPMPGLKRIDGAVQVNMQIPGFILRYRSDGGEPDAHSPVVTGPLHEHGTLRVAAFTTDGRRGRAAWIDNP